MVMVYDWQMVRVYEMRAWNEKGWEYMECPVKEKPGMELRCLMRRAVPQPDQSESEAPTPTRRPPGARWEDEDWKPTPDGAYLRGVTEDGKWDGKEHGRVFPRQFAADIVFTAEIGRTTFKTKAVAKQWVEMVTRLRTSMGAL